MDNMDDLAQGADICRVCRSEGMPEQPLFHPCICTGSIKFIHQDCLDQWMRYSHNKSCEICNYQFLFTPFYAPDMPRRLPIKDVAAAIISSIFTVIKFWVHISLVVPIWLFVPCTTYRIYHSLFNGSFCDVMALPFNIWSSKNILFDASHGGFIMCCTQFVFVGLIWLQEQILQGGGPEWMERDEQNNQQLNVLLLPIPEDNLIEEDDEEVDQENEDDEVDQENEDNVHHGHWNPIDWDDIAVADFTWERLLGLDGSFVFLKHAYWILSMNALIITVLASFPYHMGNLAISALALQDRLAASHFESLVNTLCGYCLIGMCLLIMHTFITIIGFRRSKRILGLSYIFVKVFLLSFVEFGVLPLVCGWWLDICSLPMFGTNFKDRLASFQLAPDTSTGIHWLVGMVYLYYFASFVFLLQEVVRPGKLGFFRNLNDPNFSPIHDLIQQGILHHGRRLLVSTMVFGTAVFFILWVPIRIIKFVWPSFLPYYVTLHSDSINEFFMELLLLQIVLTAIPKHTHACNLLKMGIRYWCIFVFHLLGIKSYLFEDGEELHPVVAPLHPPTADLGAAHKEQLRRGRPVGFRVYTQPNSFAIRLIVLLILVALSVVMIGLSVITITVWLGRLTISFWSISLAIVPEPSESPITHESYNTAYGTYIGWLSVEAACYVARWLPEECTMVINQMKLWLKIGSKAMVAFIVWLGIIPFLFGILFELVMVVPFKVPLHQTPVLWLWQDWALGVLFIKISFILIIMGPDWPIRRTLRHIYRDGLMHFNLKLMMKDLALPVIAGLSLLLAVPYVITYSVVPLFIKFELTRLLVARRIYPIFTLFVINAIGIVRKFKIHYEHIKNEKYLVGKRLVNYNHTSSVSG